MLDKKWQILYKGNLAEAHLTRCGAQNRAFELIKLKKWASDDVEVKEACKCIK